MIGADFVDRHYVADVMTVKIPAIATVTIAAVLRVELFALPAELSVNWKRIFRRFLVKQPLLDARHLFQIDRRGKCAGAERSALITLLHHAVIAVPMRVNVFLFAGALQPNRWQIAET